MFLESQVKKHENCLAVPVRLFISPFEFFTGMFFLLVQIDDVCLLQCTGSKDLM